MKIAHYESAGQSFLGSVDTAQACVFPLLNPAGEPLPGRQLASLLSVQDNADFAQLERGSALSLGAVKLHAPLAEPRRNIMCVGKNYHEHAREFSRSGYDSSAQPGSDIPERPIFFTKAGSAVIGPDDPVKIPGQVTRQVDYEAELAVIIGKAGRNIPVADAYAHVFGYTIINDVTARDLQKIHKQWFKGKSLDSFCPMGPWLVTSDEIDAANLDLRCWVNNELRQQANTRDLIFDIPHLIAELSAGMTLYPGDIIATGTPAGVGVGFSPPVFLAPGDKIVIEIAGIGRLSNTVEAE